MISNQNNSDCGDNQIANSKAAPQYNPEISSGTLLAEAPKTGAAGEQATNLKADKFVTETDAVEGLFPQAINERFSLTDQQGGNVVAGMRDGESSTAAASLEQFLKTIPSNDTARGNFGDSFHPWQGRESSQTDYWSQATDGASNSDITRTGQAVQDLGQDAQAFVQASMNGGSTAVQSLMLQQDLQSVGTDFRQIDEQLSLAGLDPTGQLGNQLQQSYRDLQQSVDTLIAGSDSANSPMINAGCGAISQQIGNTNIGTGSGCGALGQQIGDTTVGQGLGCGGIGSNVSTSLGGGGVSAGDSPGGDSTESQTGTPTTTVPGSSAGDGTNQSQTGAATPPDTALNGTGDVSLPSQLSNTDTSPSGYGSSLTDPLGPDATQEAVQDYINQAGNVEQTVQPGDLVVDQSGADGGYTTIQAAVDAAQNGQTIIVDAGTYSEDVQINGKSVNLLGQPGATIDATGQNQGILISNADNVTVQGLTVENANNPSQQGQIEVDNSENVNIVNDISKNSNAAGIRTAGSTNVAIIGDQMINNYQEGFAISPGSSNVLMSDNLISGNNAAGSGNAAGSDGINSGGAVSTEFEAGGGKVDGASGVTVENNISQNNVGPGIWFDTDQVGTNTQTDQGNLIQHNWVSNNSQGAGIMTEISNDMLVQNNVVWNNNANAGSIWGPQIFTSTSSDVTVQNNLVVSDVPGAAGISFGQEDRGTVEDDTQNDVANNNIIIAGGSNPQGSLGYMSNDGGGIFNSTNTASGNEIYGPNGGDVVWNGTTDDISSLPGNFQNNTLLTQQQAQQIVTDAGIDSTV